MTLLDHISKNTIKRTRRYCKAQHWAFFLLTLLGFWSGAAWSDLSITSIVQSPVNNVPTDTTVTYMVTVAYSGTGQGEFAAFSIVDGNSNTLNSSFNSPQCGLDGYFYCATVSSVDTFSFSWVPPAAGTYDLNFNLICSPTCNGDQQQVTTIVGNQQNSSPPTADAGLDQTVTDTDDNGIESVTLDGSGSYDPDNDIIGYQWFDGQQSLGTGVNLTVDLAVGTHNLALWVTDSTENVATDNVVVTVLNPPAPAPSPPVANAGPDQNLTDTNNDGIESVTLDGSASTDPDDDITGYSWYQGQQLLGTGVSVTADLPVGVHTLTLMVMDSAENLATDEVVVTIQQTSNSGNTGQTIETVSGENQQLSQGESSQPLTIRLIDANGQPQSGAEITWSVVPVDAAILNSTTTTTDTNGQSANTVTPTANKPGSTFQVFASVSSGISAKFLVNPLTGISGLSEAQRSIAGALDNACPAIQALTGSLTTEQASLSATCDYLATASDQEVIAALKQIQPDEIAAQGRNSISLANIRANNILFRLNALRGGSFGPSFEQLSLTIQGEQLPAIVLTELSHSLRGGAASADSSILDNRLGIFINGSASIGDTDTTDREAGFDFETDGLTVGVDYRFTSQLVFGGAFNYVSTTSDYLSQSSELDMDGSSVSLYGSYYRSEQMFIDGILSFGEIDYDQKREFLISGVNHNLLGETEGSEYAFSLGAGYEMYNGNFTFVPQARINYVQIDVDSFSETSSGSGLGLNVDAQEIESLLATVSANMSLAYSTQYGVFMPYLAIEWEHEFKDDSRAIIARFLSDPSNTEFSILTDDPDRDYFNLGLGLTGAFSRGNSAFLYYEKMLGNKDTSQYVITAGFRAEF